MISGGWNVDCFTTGLVPKNQCHYFFGRFFVASAPIQAAFAATDTAAPVVISNYVSPTTVDVSAGPATVSIVLRAKDASGVAGAYVRVVNYAINQSQSGRMNISPSTTPEEYLLRVSLTIPYGAASGEWVLETYGLSDTVGNSTQTFQKVRSINVVSG